jgi:hypothetical protein
MSFKLVLTVALMFGFAVHAKDICDSSSNYRLYESSKKCLTLGNNLAFASLGLIAAAGLSTLVSRDMPYFFLTLSPLPLFASMPFYITGGIQRSLYNSHRTRCGNFRRTDLTMFSEEPDDIVLFAASSKPSPGFSYSISVSIDY